MHEKTQVNRKFRKTENRAMSASLARAATLMRSLSRQYNVRRPEIFKRSIADRQKVVSQLVELVEHTQDGYARIEQEAIRILTKKVLPAQMRPRAHHAMQIERLMPKISPEPVIGYASFLESVHLAMMPLASQIKESIKLVGQMEIGEIRVYEAYQASSHSKDDKTTIDGISGDWVLRVPPQISQSLGYAVPPSGVPIQLIWIGLESVGITGGTSSSDSPEWTRSDFLSLDEDEVIGWVFTSSNLTLGAGPVTINMRVSCNGIVSDYQVQVDTHSNGEEQNSSNDALQPTRLPEPVPGVSPIVVPGDFWYGGNGTGGSGIDPWSMILGPAVVRFVKDTERLIASVTEKAGWEVLHDGELANEVANEVARRHEARIG